MHDFTVGYLRCLNCRSPLCPRPLAEGTELEEGFLDCTGCRSRYPVISKIPIMVSDLPSYFAIRASLGGDLMLKSRTAAMRGFVRQALSKIRHPSDDTTRLETKWVGIYQRSKRSGLYTRVESLLARLGPTAVVLEHGCSIGRVAHSAARRAATVLGIDKSFYALAEAKRGRAGNCDFVVADSLDHPFGAQKFDAVLALNLLDIVEPQKLLRIMSSQTRDMLVLSDPYDYDRGKNSVRNQMGPDEIRAALARRGFRLVGGTSRQSYLGWNLRANPRLGLHYRVDLIAARKRH